MPPVPDLKKKGEEELPLIVLLVMVMTPPKFSMPPIPKKNKKEEEELPLIVLLVMVTTPTLLRMPPVPTKEEELPLIVLLVMVISPAVKPVTRWLSMPPPTEAMLPLTVLRVSVT